MLYKANETIHDIMLRASNVPMKWENYQDYPEDEFLFPELGENQGRKSTIGYELLTMPTSDVEFDEGLGYVYKVEAPTQTAGGFYVCNSPCSGGCTETLISG